MTFWTVPFLCCSGTFFLMEKALALRGREGEGKGTCNSPEANT